MKRVLEAVVGATLASTFLYGGVRLLIWDAHMLQRADASRGWPQAVGVVTSSGMTQRGRESVVEVVYLYVVAGQPFASQQIGFDVFQKPGGWGRLPSILARYPVGRQVLVFYEPDNPAVAVLEPGIYSPFVLPLLFGVLLAGTGVVTFAVLIHQLVYGPPPRPTGVTPRQRAIAATLVSVLIYVAITAVALDSSVQETGILAFGLRPLGLPTLAFVIALQTLLYLPMPWVFWHGMQITFQANADGALMSVCYVLGAGSAHPHLRRSRAVCLAGLAYFGVIVAAWIVYATPLGI